MSVRWETTVEGDTYDALLRNLRLEIEGFFGAEIADTIDVKDLVIDITVGEQITTRAGNGQVIGHRNGYRADVVWREP